jgi:choline dehydrogenase
MQTIQGDTVIIGGGSAGCAMAARLSANSTRQVILFEAGPDDQNLMRRVISRQPQMTGDPRFDWNFFTEPDPNMANRQLRWPRGKVLGGSSTINGLIAIRGHRDDYNRWEAMGCAGWGWKDVLPYFLRLEDFGPGASALHHVGGPLPVSMPGGRHFLCDRLVAAAQETLGISENRDFNGNLQDGVGDYAMNVTRGLIPARVSASSAYLKEARRRSNLRVITDAHVRRITFDGHRATGVEYQRSGVYATATARRQVILSAGAIGSPQLLQLSGIGDPEHLRSLGITPIVPLSGVGENLQDHLQIPSRFRFYVHSFPDRLRNACSRYLLAFQGVILQTGLFYGATNFGLFLRSDAGLTQPDIQFHLHPSAGSLRSPNGFSMLSISGWQLRPESRGRIRLRAADPLTPPAIVANYLSSEVDQRIAVTILRIARRLSESSALRPYRLEPLHPAPSTKSDAELLDHARQAAETTYHPVGTCRMGADPGSVVDPCLRVRGVQGLYVADASIMPTVISGNTHLPCVMIGEKASDIIIEDERNATGPEVMSVAKAADTV